MGSDRESEITALLHEFWASDWGVMDRFADDALLEDPLLPEPVRGKDAILETFKLCHAWADLRPELTAVVASDRLAAAEFVVNGVVTAPLDGYGDAVIGASFSFGETDVFSLDADGLVERMSIYADVAGFDAQLKTHVSGKPDPKECVRRNIAAFDAQDIDGVIGTYAEDCELLDMSQPEPVYGHEFLGSYCVQLYEAFPDIHIENLRMYAEGSVVAVQMELVGTHTQEFLGFPPTGNAIRWRTASIFEMTPGLDLIQRETYYYDRGQLVLQLQAETADAT